MYVFNANYFDDYSSYVLKNKATKPIKKRPRRKNNKEALLKVEKHNLEISKLSSQYANKMKKEPSELEKKMQQFLSSFNISYEFQKILNMKKKNGKITKFYIVDFYIPSKNLIIETDGAFHNEQLEKDALRTKQIKAQFPNVKIIRWKWHDFNSYSKMRNLLKEVQ